MKVSGSSAFSKPVEQFINPKQPNCNRNNVNWKPNYVLSQSSLGQIMETIARIRMNPKNIYEETLYNKLGPIRIVFVSQFDQMLITNSYVESQVILHNLLGNLPKGTKIFPQNHDKITLGRAKIGNLLQALYQRVDFILTRDPPTFYEKNTSYLVAFNEMRKKLTVFRQDIKKFEEGFVDAIDGAHKAQQTWYPSKSSQHDLASFGVKTQINPKTHNSNGIERSQ